MVADSPLGAQIPWLGPQAPACHRLGLSHCPGPGSLAAFLWLGPPLECPRGLGWKWEERINSQGGGIGSNRLLLPRGPRAPVLGPVSKAPGCLGTFPNKYARASSLSGKHGFPLPPPYHHHSSQLCSGGNSVGPMYGLGVRTPGAKSHT